MMIERNIIQVPDMSADELKALTKRELKLNYFDRDYAEWDFYHDVNGDPIPGRGKKFEFMIWKPELEDNETIFSEKIRRHFSPSGFQGNTAAFTQWMRQYPELMGYHASIPENKACWRDSVGTLFVPCSFFGAGYRKLDQSLLDDAWDDTWSFVAFKAID